MGTLSTYYTPTWTLWEAVMENFNQVAWFGSFRPSPSLVCLELGLGSKSQSLFVSILSAVTGKWLWGVHASIPGKE